MRTIALVSQKGGSGKSTIAVHLAVCAARRKKAVAIVDLDPQGSVLAWARRRESRLDWTPSSGIATVAVTGARGAEVPGLLERARKQGADLFLIDTPGRASVDAARVLELADVVLVPCRVGVYDLEASRETAEEVKRASRSRKTRAAFVLNGVPVRGTRHTEARTALLELLPVVPVELHYRLAYGDALADGRSVEELEPDGKAAAEIRALYACAMKLCSSTWSNT